MEDIGKTIALIKAFGGNNNHQNFLIRLNYLDDTYSSLETFAAIKKAADNEQFLFACILDQSGGEYVIQYFSVLSLGFDGEEYYIDLLGGGTQMRLTTSTLDGYPSAEGTEK